MPHDALKHSLRSLHEELSRTPSIDPELRSLLARLEQDIQAVLHPEAAAPPADQPPLQDQAVGVAQQFEESHPKLAALIGRMADSLSQLGI